MRRLTITERTEKRPVTIRSRDVVQDCRSIVNQLLNSRPKDVLLRTSDTEHRETTNVHTTEENRVESKSSVTRKFQLTEAEQEDEPCSDSSCGDKTLSGESCAFEPRQDDLSRESNSRQPRDRIFSGESRNITDSWDIMMYIPPARVMTQELSSGRIRRKLLPILMSRRLRFIPCWRNGNSAGWTGKCIRTLTGTGIPPKKRA